MVHLVADQARSYLGVVVRVERLAHRLEVALDAEVVGEAAVVHDTQVVVGGERVRSVGGDCRFGGQAGVADTLIPSSGGNLEPLDHLGR